MIPAAGVSGEVAAVGAILRDADHTTAMHAEGPLVRAGNENVEIGAVQLHTAECLGNIHGHNCSWRVRAHGLDEGRPI